MRYDAFCPFFFWVHFFFRSRHRESVLGRVSVDLASRFLKAFCFIMMLIYFIRHSCLFSLLLK